MSDTIRAACCQLTSTRDIAENVRLSSELIREAAGEGAQLVGLPEVVNMVRRGRKSMGEAASTEDQEPALKAFRELAAELGIWLLSGSLVVKLTDDDRFANRSFLIGPDGAIAAVYDKIHMFDVDLEGGESYRESKAFRPGEAAVVVGAPWGNIGMSVCYDVRFPYLYRALAKAGADILMVPAAFTRTTGRAHWHILLQARAIETGCFVMAPAQCGDHEDGRETFGHSLIVSPWGKVLADGGAEPGVIVADLDLGEVAKARRMIPSLQHDRGFTALVEPGLREAGE